MICIYTFGDLVYPPQPLMPAITYLPMIRTKFYTDFVSEEIYKVFFYL